MMNELFDVSDPYDMPSAEDIQARLDLIDHELDAEYWDSDDLAAYNRMEADDYLNEF